MKTYRAKNGPFTERPYYSDSDVEEICSTELRTVGLYPDTPSPIRIDRFIEKRFKVVPAYDDLGTKILGMTMFGASGVTAIIISRALEEEGTAVAERRIRTTLAHEAGHGLLHTHLFTIAMQNKPLFGDFTDPAKPKVLCRDEGEASPKYQGQWWEYQANQAIGSLLMPKLLVEKAVENFSIPTGLFGFRSFDRVKLEEAVKELAAIFNVNSAVARIRLDQLFPASKNQQLTL